MAVSTTTNVDAESMPATTKRKRIDDHVVVVDNNNNEIICCALQCVVPDANAPSSHRCFGCRRPLHPPCAAQQGDGDDCGQCDDCVARAASTSTRSTTISTTTTTTTAAATTSSAASTAATATPPTTTSKSGRRPRKSRAKKINEPYELQFNCALIRGILSRQLRVESNGVDRVVRFWRRTAAAATRNGMTMRVGRVADKYDGQMLLYLYAEVAATMKKEDHQVQLWLRADGSLSYGLCSCRMGKAGVLCVCVCIYVCMCPADIETIRMSSSYCRARLSLDHCDDAARTWRWTHRCGVVERRSYSCKCTYKRHQIVSP